MPGHCPPPPPSSLSLLCFARTQEARVLETKMELPSAMNSGCCVRVGVISLGGAQGRVLRPAAATQQRVVVYTASFEFQPCLSKCDTTA